MVTWRVTTEQEPLNGHRVFPPPCSSENPSDRNLSDLQANKDNNNHVPLQSQISDLRSPDAAPAPAAGSYHVPPKRFAPKANAYGHDDFLNLEMDTSKLPERCQFMFSDGRQCTMARSEIHPSLCRYHCEREEQLFGDPFAESRGRALDLPELFSACRDLTTARGVSLALAQVFRLLAQRRISRQEAATFAKLGQLLLQTFSAARSSCETRPPRTSWSSGASRRSQSDQELSRVNKVDAISTLQDASVESLQHSTSPLRYKNGGPVRQSEQDIPITNRDESPSEDQQESVSTAVHGPFANPHNLGSSPESSAETSNSRIFCTCAKSADNALGMNTYTKTRWRRHSQTRGSKAMLRVPHP